MERPKQIRRRNYLKYREERLAYARQYRENNREAVCESQRRWRVANPTQVKSGQKAWREQNPEKVKLGQQRWRAANPYYKQQSGADKKYRSKPEVRKLRYLRTKIRRQSDPHFDIMFRLSRRMRDAVKAARTNKKSNTIGLLGCTAEQFIAHLERQFTEGMTWENRHQWHIDHKIPCASFDLTDPEQQQQCFHWSNLQPLWALDNIRKGKKKIEISVPKTPDEE